MEVFHHITVFLISEPEKASLVEAGIVFRNRDVTRGPRGESASFNIFEEDPRWGKVGAILASLGERDGMPKEFRVQDLSNDGAHMGRNHAADEGKRCGAP